MRAPLALAGLAVLAAAAGHIAGPSHAAAPLCQGQEATIVSSGPQVQGTEGDDVIVVTPGGDITVHALGGDDSICADVSVRVRGGAGHDSLKTRMGPRADYLVVDNEVEELDVRTGGGFDEVEIYGAHGTGTLDAGGGGGILKPYAEDDVLVDVEDRFMTVDGGAGSFVVKRFSRISAHATSVTVFGDELHNTFSVVACRAKLVGGRGNDTMMARSDSMHSCSRPGATMYGLKGDDRMIGSRADDRLIGGRGQDKANGGDGDDRCQAEVHTSC